MSKKKPAQLSSEEQFWLKQSRVRKLMNYAAHRMQPSALKHAYLASVANVLQHPVKAAVNKSNREVGYMVGYGDVARTLPLFLIIDATPPDKDNPQGGYTVRHAFPPNPQAQKGEPEEWALQQLQLDENQWAQTHGARPRNIRKEISHQSRNRVCQHGINSQIDADFQFNAEELQQLNTWFATDYLPANQTITHKGRPNLTDPVDLDKINSNIADSLNHNVDTSLPHTINHRYVVRPSIDVHLNPGDSHRNGFKINKRNLVFHDTEVEEIDPDDFEME